MAAKRRPAAKVVKSGVKSYQSRGEARGVVKNLRAGGATRKKQLKALKQDVWGELSSTRARKVMKNARKIGKNR